MSAWAVIFRTDEGRVRAVWRLLMFALLFVLFAGLMGIGFVALGWSGLFTQGLGMLMAALFAGWVPLALLDRRPIGALGFAWTRQTPRDLGLGMLVGVGALVVAVLGIAAVGALRYGSDAGDWGDWASTQLFWLAGFAFPAAAEEALFRGYAFQVLAQSIGGWVATLLASAAFAVAHIGNPNVTLFALVNIFLAGILLSVAYLRTRSLWFATALHLGWNWAMATLFDLPVSGLGLVDTPVYQPHIGGPAWWTGTDFGPEGGLVATLGFVAALITVLRWRAIRPDAGIVALRPLVDDRDGAMTPVTPATAERETG